MRNFIFNKIGKEGPHGNPQFLFYFPVEQLYLYLDTLYLGRI